MTVLASLPVLVATEFQSKNAWLPETPEIIWGTLAFLIVAFVIVKYGGPPMKAGLKARSDRIGKQISDAAAAREEAERTAARITADLKDIDAERGRILAAARAEGDQLRAAGLARNDQEVADLEAAARTDIETGRGRVASELQAHVARMSAEVAERVVVGRLDAATQQDLVEQFVARVGSSAGSPA